MGGGFVATTFVLCMMVAYLLYYSYKEKLRPFELFGFAKSR